MAQQSRSGTLLTTTACQDTKQCVIKLCIRPSLDRCHMDVLNVTQCREAVTACTTTSLLHMRPQPVVNLVASLGNLTKLHLTLDDHRQDRSQLRSLDKLCFLQDLALQCVHAQCCHGVLQSSRHSVLFVDLAAKSWSPQTYKHLQVTPNLE